jgi:spoIIIJ-associated protein
MTAEKSGEFRGKSVEVAIENGLMALGLSRDEVEVEIVRRGSRGVLGIGAEDAVVRITARQAAPKEPAPGPAPEPPQMPEARPALATPEQRVAQPSLPPPETLRPAQRPAPRPAARPSEKPEARPYQKAEPKPVQRLAVRPSQGIEKPEPQAILPPEAAAAAVAKDARELEAAQRGRELLAGLLERMDMPAAVEIVPQSEAEADEDGQRALVLNIVGEDLGTLIGRQGDVLTAMQMITRLMVSRTVRGRHNLIVDVNGYRARRAESLRRLALRMADQVTQAGRTMALEPMPPAERRIIHLTLRNHPNVTTLSVGEGDRRKVTIIPKKG